ncbi:MAG: HEAT repeat domain-containing protein [Planctomycetes bacterium]|nr:HEAT repeat domain-containing protein [Planctomycetota bacterium]
MKQFALALWALVLFVFPAQGFELGPETRDYDQVNLGLAIELDLERGEVSGTVRIALVPAVEDFRMLRLHSKDSEIRSVTVSQDGKEPRPAASFRVEEGLLVAELDHAYAKGASLVVEIRYLSRPTAGLYFFRPTADHPEIPLQVWSQGEGEDNRHWIPCYDLPDDRLTSNLTVEAPRDLAVYSNGVLVETKDGSRPGTRVWHWRQEAEHVTYLITLVAGRFDTVEGLAGKVPLFYHVPPGRKDEVPLAFGNTPEMVEFFAGYTGAPYPWPVYRQIVVWDFMYGGMENTGATTLNLRALHDERVHGDYLADYLVAHELAHMWFGDLVTCLTFDHIWLNEGFATYFTDLWVESHFGHTAFLGRRRDDAAGWVSGSTTESRAKLVKKGDTTPIELPSFAYIKGSAVLHLLRGVLGDDRFREGIRRYVAERAGKSVETKDFQDAMEEASGEDLDWLFDPWVYGSGYPEYEVAWEWKAASRQAIVRVKQVQVLEKHRGLFRVPVVLAFTFTGEPATTERRTVWVEKVEHEFAFDLPARPDVVRFDEGNFVPKKVKFEREVPELSLALVLDPDPTGRMDAADSLAERGLPASEALSGALVSEEERLVRQKIAAALAKSGGEPARRALLRALAEDPASEVRRAAAEGLSKFEGEEVVRALKRALAKDASDYVARAAAESLGKVAKKDAVEVLVETLDRSSYADVVRRGALAGLVAAGDPGALPQFLKFADYPWGAGGQHELAREALEGAVSLAGADHPEVLARLLERLADPYFRTRQLAAKLLADAGRLDAVGPILDAARAERMAGVRDAFDREVRRLAETAAKRDADPLAGRSDKELARMLEKARAASKEADREAEKRKRWVELLEAAAGKDGEKD